MITKRFIKSSIIYSVAGALPMASAVILAPYYAANLTPEGFGAWALLLGFSALVQIIVTFSFDSSIYVHYHKYKNYPQRLGQLISSVYLFVLGLSMLVVGLLFFLGNLIFETVYPATAVAFAPFGWLSVFSGVCYGLIKIESALFQVKELPKHFLIVNLATFFLLIVCTIAAFRLFPEDLFAPVSGRFLASFAVALFLVVRTLRQTGIHFCWFLLRPLFQFNLASFVYQLQQWFMAYFDRVILAFLLPLSSVGVYDLAMKCLLVIDLILIGLNSAFMPRAIEVLSRGATPAERTEINRFYHGLSAASLLVVTLAMVVLPPVVLIFFDFERYGQVLALLPVASVAYLVKPLRLAMAMPFGALRYSRPLPFIYLAVMALKFATMFWLIPYVGLWGALYATIFAACAEIALLYVAIKPRFTFTMNPVKMVAIPLCVGSAILFFEPRVYSAHALLLHAIYLALTVLLLVTVYRKELTELWMRWKNKRLSS